MFKSISWQQFINVSAIVIGCYYIIAIVLLYSKEIIQKIKGQPAYPSDQSNVSAVDLMGKIKNDVAHQYEHSVDGQELNISSDSQDSLGNEHALLLGSVSDLFFELKTLFKVVREGSGNREEAISMVTTLLSNYSFLVNTKYFESINLFIRDQFKEQFSLQIEFSEINKWWSIPESNN